MPKLLLVDDDQVLSDLLSTYLNNQGFDVVAAYNGQKALDMLEQSTPDLIILDIMMPILDGLETLKEIRKQSDIPVLMLTAKTEDIDRIIGLEMGADDYLAKPCNPRELVARVKAILRRISNTISHQNAPQKKTLTLGSVTIDPGRFEAFVQNQLIALTGAEFKLLQTLLEQPSQILSKEYLTEAVLNRPLEAYDRAIDVHISNLRKKLSRLGINSNVISNIRNQGYLLKQEHLGNLEASKVSD